MSAIPDWFNRLKAACPAQLSIQEASRSAFAALLGLALTAAITAAFWHGNPPVLLVTPVAASLVILYALPHSPLGHPWAVLAGSLLAATIGLLCAAAIPLPLAAGLVAVPVAIFTMARLRCLHPPAGAQALLFAMSGHELLHKGVLAALAPLAANLTALLLGALIFNNLIQGRRYGFLAAATKQRTADPSPLRRSGLTDEDLQHALTRLDSYLDISEADLVAVFDAATAHAFQRSSALTCGDIMSRDVRTVELDTGLEEAWGILARHDIKALPVVDRARRVVGVVTRRDFLHRVEAGDAAGLGERLKTLLRARRPKLLPPSIVGDIMVAQVFVAREDTPVMELVNVLCHGGKHHIPIVDARRRLAGMLTQSDLLAALYHQAAWHGRHGGPDRPPEITSTPAT